MQNQNQQEKILKDDELIIKKANLLVKRCFSSCVRTFHSNTLLEYEQ